MRLTKAGAVLVLTIFIWTATACQKTSPSPEKTATGSNTAPGFQHAQGGTTPQGQTKHFKGSIGSALDLQMKLVREGEKLAGSYFYQKVGTKIDLRGSIDADGNLVLDEFDPSGKQTGTFRGAWKTEDTGLVTLAGNWSAPNSNRQTAFSLHEQPIEFSGAVEIVDRKIAESNKKLKYEIDVVYPQLSGSASPNFEKFNQLVRSMVTSKVNDFKKEMVPEPGEETTTDGTSTTGSDFNIGYSIALAKDDLISLSFGVGSYYAGAAHPNSYSESFNFDLKSGKAIKLGDLFNSGSKYVQVISAYAIQDLKKQAKAQGDDSMLDDDWVQRGAGPDPKNYESWTIGKTGLGITFDAYQVAPYAAGPQEVKVPYSALKDIIRVDGPIGQFVK
ncbi:MAG TPA: DUF3298 domain-containing protein [Pyrinomonadaceae bacterium]|nr:DUF3298 domain-containing protein [Pyrinomonadaceae bacterium]